MAEENSNKRVKKRFLIPVIIVICVIAGVISFYNSLKYESTDDAYVETHTVSVVPKVSGHIVKLYVKDNQHVKEGQLVAEIDDTDYKVKVEQATAAYQSALFRQTGARANLDSVNSQIELAKKNLERYTELYKTGAASKLEYDTAKTNYDKAKAAYTQAEENVLSKGNKRAADADIKQLEALKKQAELALSYTKIYARQTGSVSGKNIEEGSFVQAGQPLFTIVPDKVWVVANFKENQLQHMKVGQEVEIKVDTYPKKAFKGKIDSIQRISGAKSSLFPPENAVGSFVKIVQRIPVKIVFTEKIDKQKYTIVPGMSVVPLVRVKK